MTLLVGNYVLLARVAGVDWASAQTLTDEALEVRLYRPAVPRASYQLAPDFGLVTRSSSAPASP